MLKNVHKIRRKLVRNNKTRERKLGIKEKKTEERENMLKEMSKCGIKGLIKRANAQKRENKNVHLLCG